MRKFTWSNIPIPEGHVILLLVGLALHLRRPLRLFGTRRLSHAIGWPALLSGILVAGWAVATSRDIDISRPARLIVSGPYAISRNPMYVAWTAIYLGIAALVNTWWLILQLPVLIALTHFVAVRHEERQLEQRFGEAYRRYCARVRRYL